MSTPDFLLLMRGDVAVGTAFPRVESDGALSLHVTMDACEFFVSGDEASLEGGQLRLTFAVKPTNFNNPEADTSTD